AQTDRAGGGAPAPPPPATGAKATERPRDQYRAAARRPPRALPALTRRSADVCVLPLRRAVLSADPRQARQSNPDGAPRRRVPPAARTTPAQRRRGGCSRA